MAKKFTGKVRQNADDITLNPPSGVLVTGRCPLTGVPSFISCRSHPTKGSCAITDILQYSAKKLCHALCELNFMQCRKTKIVV